MMFKKQKKTSWFPAQKKQKSKKGKKVTMIGLGVGTIGVVVAGLVKPKKMPK